jgi:hypothetical protein
MRAKGELGCRRLVLVGAREVLGRLLLLLLV